MAKEETMQVSVTKKEADLIIQALTDYQTAGAKIANSADKLGIKKAAGAVVEFSKDVEELKSKFL